jgi:cobalt-precorrin 5A hydrolase
MKKQDWVFISLTKKGLALCMTIKDALKEDAQILSIHKRKTDYTKNFESFGELIKYAFESANTLVFVMATGIVVRSIKEYVVDKTTDPAVLVLDENGQYCISLLSGHIGGANDRAKKIEKAMGAKAVITTASDVSKKTAVDMIAKKLSCDIDDMTKAKDVTAMIVNGDRVMIDYHGDADFGLDSDDISNLETYDGAVYISEKAFDNEHHNVVKLTPKNVVLGMGCKRGMSEQKVIDLIKAQLEENKISDKSIFAIASIDIKNDEAGLIAAAKYFDAKLITFSASEIALVEEKFEGSDFVKQTVGVSCVSEPAGYLASNFGEQIGKIKKQDGMTISIWKIG